MAGALVPEDDLYARLEVGVDASPEAIELAWRALLKRHHPDVAGDTHAALERAKRINVAHDWLSDAGLRARYDRERLGLGAIPPGRARTGVRHGRPPRAWPPQPAPRPAAARARAVHAARTSSAASRRSASNGSSTASRGCPTTSSTASPPPSRRRSRSWRRSGGS